MTRRVLLVRHAAPSVAPEVDPADWPLSGAGAAAAAALRDTLPPAALWIASAELKAVETLTRARSDPSHQVRQDARLNEVRRPGEPFDDDVIHRRSAWVEGRLDERHASWETPHEVGIRMEAAIAAHAADGDTMVVGSHGMAITTLLVHLGRVGPGQEAGEFWRRIAMPDVVEIDF